jgi:hypothetical protein
VGERSEKLGPPKLFKKDLPWQYFDVIFGFAWSNSKITGILKG